MAKETEEIILNKKYTYNKDTDVYITPLKSRAKPLVISGAKHRAILKALTNTLGTPMTVDEVATKFKIPAKHLEEYKKIYGITRDILPLTDEEVEDGSVDDLAQSLLEAKKFEVSQAYEKISWKDTQKDADSWRDFVSNQLDPFSVLLETWTPPKLNYKALDKKDISASQRVLVVGISDLHYGSAANQRYIYNKSGWSTQDTVKAVERYAKFIERKVKERTYSFEKLAVLCLGDLIHSLLGKTARGTELKYDCIREEQFEYALNSLCAFITAMVNIIPNVEVHSVYGNHNYETEMALFRALENYFKPDSRIVFHHYSTRPAAFIIGKTLFLADHGADSVERAYVPSGSESKLQQHVQSLLLDIPEKLVDIKSRIFAMGDKHHWEHIEYRDFEFVMFGTIIGSDEHASVNNLKNRPRQSCLVLDETGLSEVLHFYVE